LKAENYLLNCRVETISSPSKQAPRIFQTSPEHPNARIIITPPYAAKASQRQPSLPGGDIFDPQLPSKPQRRPTVVAATTSDDNVRRTSGRKRTVTGKYDDGASMSDSDSLDEGYTSRKKKRVSESKDILSNSGEGTSRRRKSSTKLLEANDGGVGSNTTTPTRKNREDKSSRPPSSSKSNREKEARLDRRENEELYETLQKQVTIELLKRRYSSLHPTFLVLY
jgi:hypothetical protein